MRSSIRGRVWDFTDRGEGLRNTISLRGRRGTGHGPVHWTANFDEIHDFEHDIRGEFGGAGLMSDADFNATKDPLGTPKAGRSNDLDALAAYVTSLDTYPRSPHRQADGAMTSAAIAGQAIFKQLDCASCHMGSDFTDSATGQRHDVGTIASGSGQRIGGTLDGLDTPTLRGIWNTAPYLHDGSFATLADLIAGGGPAHGNMAALSNSEQAQLKAYLEQLDGSNVNPGRPDNTDPVITAIAANPNPVNGTATQLTALAADADDDSLSYVWTVSVKPVGSTPSIGPGPQPTVIFDLAGTYRFTLTVNDGRGGVVSDVIEVEVLQAASSIELNHQP